jgi:hypothetical protein
MKTDPKTRKELLFAPEDLSAVQEKVTEWLKEQNSKGEFELSWTCGGSFVGGAFVNVNSSAELADVVFGY